MKKARRPSFIESYILKMLIAGGGRQMYPLQMVKESSGRLRRGTIYITLARMEDKGFISSKLQTDLQAVGSKKRFYKISGLGRRSLIEWELPSESVGTLESINEKLILGNL